MAVLNRVIVMYIASTVTIGNNVPTKIQQQVLGRTETTHIVWKKKKLCEGGGYTDSKVIS
jgi:hypothetical protein